MAMTPGVAPHTYSLRPTATALSSISSMASAAVSSMASVSLRSRMTVSNCFRVGTTLRSSPLAAPNAKEPCPIARLQSLKPGSARDYMTAGLER